MGTSSGGETFLDIVPGNTTLPYVTNSLPSGTYYFKVTAVYGSGPGALESPLSNEASDTITLLNTPSLLEAQPSSLGEDDLAADALAADLPLARPSFVSNMTDTLLARTLTYTSTVQIADDLPTPPPASYAPPPDGTDDLVETLVLAITEVPGTATSDQHSWELLDDFFATLSPASDQVAMSDQAASLDGDVNGDVGGGPGVA
jgi:hypothetical protein